MNKFDKLSGIAAPMPMVNIDTDMIIPKQFLKTIKRSGLGVNLFDEMRYDRDGNEVPDFVLNKPQYRDAQIPASPVSSRPALRTSSTTTVSRTASCRSPCRKSRWTC